MPEYLNNLVGSKSPTNAHHLSWCATSQAIPDVRRPPLNSANYNTTSNSSLSSSYDDEPDYEATPNTIDTHPDADDVCLSDILPLISPPVSSSNESTGTSTSQLSLSLGAPHGAPFIA
ncbi:hypothetical protein EDC96DRAFT_584511 [Choanephora cucurbitarum]|nr:hypothetical protein EDC96DRAFT_584511 [Choanephora cucurbitarum]